MIRAILGSAIFTVVVPAMVAGYIPWLIATSTPTTMRFDIGPARYIGAILFAIGVAIYFWCISDFIRARGTPAPIAPTKEMVHRGLYRIIRNPMYVGVLSAITGQAIWFGSWTTLIYGVAVFIIVHLFVITYEEPTLRQTFGESYEQYCRDVPRWIPRIGPRKTV